jgi:LolD_lipo_ex: lipoprotein releasing system, ATP-binding protein
MVNCQSSE